MASVVGAIQFTNQKLSDYPQSHQLAHFMVDFCRLKLRIVEVSLRHLFQSVGNIYPGSRPCLERTFFKIPSFLTEQCFKLRPGD